MRASSEQMPLLSDIVLGTTDYAEAVAVDLLSGRTAAVRCEREADKTHLRAVEIPDYPIVIRLTRAPQ